MKRIKVQEQRIFVGTEVNDERYGYSCIFCDSNHEIKLKHQ